MKKYLFLLAVLLIALTPAEPKEAQAFLIGGVATSSGGGGGSCSYTPPLDANSAAAAFGFRLLRTAYSGGNVVTLQRSSDSTQKTFTLSTSNCTINQSDAFFDGSTYTVVTWFDQSGNGANVTQATNANRPTVTLNCQNSQPCAVFNGTSAILNGTLASAVGADTFAAVAKDTSTSSTYMIHVGVAANSTQLQYSSVSAACVSGRAVGGTTVKGTAACTVNTWYRWIGTQNGTLSSLYINGTKGTDDTSSQTLVASTTFAIGAATVPSNYWPGSIAEAIIFAPDLSITNSNIVTANQGSFWGL